MPDPRPLHVRVAEALGWTELRCAPIRQFPAMWMGKPPESQIAATGCVTSVERIDHETGVVTFSVSGATVPRYDLDWSALGPVIEKYGILLARSFSDNDKGWIAAWPGRWEDCLQVGDTWVEAEVLCTADGATPLIATCELLLMAAEKDHFSA